MKETLNQLKNEILSEIVNSTELDSAVNKVLKQIGLYFNVDRAYIFENDTLGLGCKNTFEWCNKGVAPEIKNLQYLSYETDLGYDWMDNYNEDGLFFCPNVKDLPQKQRNVLEPQGIFSMLQCSIKERGEFKGFIGFDNCQDHLSGWEYDQDAIDTLVFASRLLSLYLLEYRNKSSLLAQQENLKAALDEAVSSNKIINFVAGVDYDYIMVIDIPSDTYKIYSNENDTSMLNVLPENNYTETFTSYAKKYVPLEDQFVAIDEMRTDFLKKKLENNETFTSQAHVIEEDGTVRVKQAKFAFLDESHEKIVATRTDITDLVEASEKEKKALENALAEAKKANLAKTDFLARMSHDIRTPMNAIIGLTALALDEDNLTPKIKDYLNNIRGSGDFLLGLVNDILDMSKIEAGSVKLKEAPYLYTDFLNKIKTMFEPQCKAKNISFIMEEPPFTASVLVDKLRLDQIFFNLLSNAAKFTPENGTIIYRTQNAQLDEKHLSLDIVIQDSGIGMSKEFLKHIFVPFEQEDAESYSNQPGTGLGLAIVKSLVDLMGGTIKIESEKNKGTTITVHLNLEVCPSDISKDKSRAKIAIESVNMKGKHVLLAEDHPLNAQIATTLLEKRGLPVTHAKNGVKAVEIFEASEPNYFDVILMDIRMPFMDGLEATKKIRNLAKADAKTVPIIAMSANAYEEDKEKSLAAGMNFHLAKPINIDELFETLAKVFTGQLKA